MTVAIDEKTTKTVTWPQWIAGVGVLFLVAQVGLMGAWSSPYVAQLSSPEAPFPATTSQLSWVVSLLNLGRLCGAIVGPICVNYFGSKTTVLFTSVPMAFCWMFIILADRVEWLYSARFLAGISLGMIYGCFSLYLGEIADPNIRGALVSTGIAGLSIGNFLMGLMGAYLPMKTSAAIALAPCVALMFLFLWLPESPHHLIKKQLDEKAKSSIGWYHRGCDVETEFVALQTFVENQCKQSLSDSLKELKKPHYRNSLILASILFMYSQLSGINNILFYMEMILRSAKVTVIRPAQVVTIVIASGMISSFLTTFLMDRFGRRILMVVSSTGIALALGLLTVDFHLLNFHFDPKTLEGLPIFAMIFFQISVYTGVLSVPLAVLSEIFPSHLKCIASLFSSCLSSTVSFISTLSYLPLLDVMTEQYLFLFYGLLMLTAVPFTLLFVPETKGLSLQEIQIQLSRKK